MPEQKRCSKGRHCQAGHKRNIAIMQPIGVFQSKGGTKLNTCQTCRTHHAEYRKAQRKKKKAIKETALITEPVWRSLTGARLEQFAGWVAEVTGRI